MRRAPIDPNRAIDGEPAPGDPRAMKPTTAGQAQVYGSPLGTPTVVKPFDPDEILNLTTYLAVVDKDHNMVSLTSSLLSGFGSGMVVDERRLLHERPHALLEPRSERRQLAAAGQARAPDDQSGDGVERRQAVDRVRDAGADTQPQTQLQFFLNVAEFGMQRAAGARAADRDQQQLPRFVRSARVKGKLMTPAMLDAKRSATRSRPRGTSSTSATSSGVGSVKAILIDPRTGVLMGGVSPTGDSYVMAW